jgi:hypothetical protein
LKEIFVQYNNLRAILQSCGISSFSELLNSQHKLPKESLQLLNDSSMKAFL